MRLPEQRLWDRFLPRLREVRIHAQRVENGLVDGMPDVLLLCRGRVVCVELKAREDMPFHEGTAMFTGQRGLSREQRNWHRTWGRFGGVSYILAAVGRSHFLVHGQLADEFNAMCFAAMRERAAASDWQAIMTLLSSGGLAR